MSTPKEHALYKYEHNGEIIYIGKTNTSISARLKAHAKEKKFQGYSDAKISVLPLKNSTETDILEKLLINHYRPVLNVIDNHQEHTDIQFKEPAWEPYCPKITKPSYRKKSLPIYPGMKYRHFYLTNNHLSREEATLIDYLMWRIIAANGEKKEFIVSTGTLEKIFGKKIYDTRFLDILKTNILRLHCAYWCGDTGTKGSMGSGDFSLIESIESWIAQGHPIWTITVADIWKHVVLNPSLDYAYLNTRQIPRNEIPWVIHL